MIPIPPLPAGRQGLGTDYTDMRREREALSQSSLISLGWEGRNANHEANSGPLTTNNGNIPSHGLQ